DVHAHQAVAALPGLAGAGAAVLILGGVALGLCGLFLFFGRLLLSLSGLVFGFGGLFFFGLSRLLFDLGFLTAAGFGRVGRIAIVVVIVVATGGEQSGDHRRAEPERERPAQHLTADRKSVV